MTSSTFAGSNALPTKSQSPAEPAKPTHSVHSPPDSNAPSAPTSRPSSAASVRAKLDAPLPSVNGDNASDAAGAQDESEAETDILSAPESSETEGRKETIKRERSDEPTADSMPPSAKPGLNVADADSTSNTDSASHEPNGIKKNGVSNTPNGNMLPPSPKSLTQSKKGHDRDDSRRSPSIGSTASPTLEGSERTRASSTADAKKRKLRDDRHSGSVEPPRQRKLDAPPRVTTTSSSRTQPTSPTSPATSGLRTHKRSASTQSNIPTGQKRKRRELSTAALSLHDKNSWHSDSSSEASSSPRPPPVPHLQPHARNSRSSQRALTSPARATMPRKNLDRFGATRFARECERGDLDTVKAAYESAPHELDVQDHAGHSPLQKAALKGYVDVVTFLLEKKCRLDLASKEGDTPLIDAVENGHVDVVRALLAAGVNPHHQNQQGTSALDVLPEEDENALELENLLRQAMREHEYVPADNNEHMPPPAVSKHDQNTNRNDLLYAEPTRENLRKYAAMGDAVAVNQFLLTGLEPDLLSAIAAARGGHEMVLNLILASSSRRLEPDPDPATHADTPLLATIGRGHLDVIRLLLDQDNFNPTRRTRDGQTYYELAESRRGPRWQQESDLLKERYDAYKTRHPLKTKKRVQSSGNNSVRSIKHGSKEPSSSPKALQKPKPRAEASEAPVRQRRLISAKDRQERDSKVKRRAVISDDDSSAAESEISKAESEARWSSKVRSPDRKRLKLSERRKSDVHEYEKERAKVKASKSRPSSSPIDLHRKSTQDRTKARLRPESPIVDEPRKKKESTKPAKPRSDLNSTKDHEKENRITYSPITKSPEPVRDETPEAEREARRLEAERKKAEAEKAEKARQEAERARLEAERAEAEARRKREEEERLRKAQEEQRLREEAAERLRKEEEERARQARIDALPLPVRRACLEGMNRSVKGNFVECGIDFNFTPIHVFKRTQIEPGYDESKPDAGEWWMFSHQAIGVLGLPDPDVARCKPEWTLKDVSQAQREFFVKRKDLVEELAMEKHWTYEGEPGYDDAWTQAQIADGKTRFLNMQPLYFVKFSEFETDVRKVEKLRDLDLRPRERRLTPKPGPRMTPLQRIEEMFKTRGVKTQVRPAKPAFAGPGGTLPLGPFIGVHGPDGPGGTPTKLPLGFGKGKEIEIEKEKEVSVEAEKD